MKRMLRNDFSWSKSRHEKFVECQRAYLFHYYQSWGGWDKAAPARTRELYVLKKLSNRYTWAGNIVHSNIRDALHSIRRGESQDAGAIIDRARDTMRSDFVASKKRVYWTQNVRKDFSGLVEHEYEERVSDDVWRENWANVEQALSWFFSSDWPRQAQAWSPEQVLEIDEMDFDRSFCTLDGVKVFAAPDLAFRGDDGCVHIIDWKTGRSREGYDEQVVLYALYLEQRYSLPIDRMQATLVYLNQGEQKTVAIDKASIDTTLARFHNSVASMRNVLADVSGNVPASEERFVAAQNAEACARCPFRRPCGMALAAGETRATECDTSSLAAQ